MKLLLTNWLSVLHNIFFAIVHSTIYAKIVQFIMLMIAFTIPSFHYFFCVYFLLFLDTLTGIAKAKKNGTFNSKELRKGIIDKVVLYNLMFISFLIVDVFLKDFFKYTMNYASGISCFMIAYYEIISLVENMKELQPQNPIINNIYNLLLIGRKKINDKIESKIDEL